MQAGPSRWQINAPLIGRSAVRPLGRQTLRGSVCGDLGRSPGRRITPVQRFLDFYRAGWRGGRWPALSGPAGFEYFWNKGGPGALQQADVGEFAGEGVGQGVFGLAAFAHVEGGVGGLQVAPALERAFGRRRDAGHR